MRGGALVHAAIERVEYPGHAAQAQEVPAWKAKVRPPRMWGEASSPSALAAGPGRRQEQECLLALQGRAGRNRIRGKRNTDLEASLTGTEHPPPAPVMESDPS